jgi:hypothetical protein
VFNTVHTVHAVPCRTLPKTVAYLQSKRPDLLPRPGFMRQLQALDASLQRVTRAAARTGTTGGAGGAAGKDATLRRYSEWAPELLGKLDQSRVYDC